MIIVKDRQMNEAERVVRDGVGQMDGYVRNGIVVG